MANPNRVTVKRCNGEWCAVVYRDGKRDENATYYASDKEDAENSAEHMRAEMERLPEEQERALRAFALREGSDWKEALCIAWMRGSEPGPLQALRNQRGPSWLADFTFPDKDRS